MRRSLPGVGGGLVLFGLATAFAALTIPLGPDGGWGARFFPLMAASLVVMAGLADGRTALQQGGAAQPRATDEQPKALRRIVLLALIGTVYVWLISQFGYLLASLPVAPLVFWVFGERRIPVLVGVALLVPLLLHLFFFRLLGAFPPLGRWIDLLDFVTVL